MYVAGAMRWSCSGRSATVLPESEIVANRQWGFPRNLGDPVVSTVERGRRGCRTQNLPVHRF